MANIDQYIEQIENARYGNEVRQAIVDALTAMNAEISSSGVTSFNERRGHVISTDGDYNISQISATGGIQGQVPVVNSHGGFTMRDMTGEVVELNQLTDVNISSPSNYDMLRYYGSTQKWQNVAGMTTRVGSADATDGRHDVMRITSSNVLNLCGMPVMASNGTYTILPFACTEMPIATDYLVGTMVLYLGTTSASYTQGNVYKCVLNGNTYEWQLVCNLMSNNSGMQLLSTAQGDGVKTYGECLDELYSNLESTTDFFTFGHIYILYVTTGGSGNSTTYTIMWMYDIRPYVPLICFRNIMYTETHAKLVIFMENNMRFDEGGREITNNIYHEGYDMRLYKLI